MQDQHNYSGDLNDLPQHNSSSDSDHNNEDEKIPEPMNPSSSANTNIIVLTKAQTWNRESHGLYDYESRHVSRFEQKFETGGFMVRNSDDIRFESSTDILDEQDDTVLLNLRQKPAENEETEKYYVRPINSNPANDRLWHVIRSLRGGHVIQRHDIIKLGRMKFKVKEYRSENEYFEGEHNEVSPHDGFEEFLDVEQATDDETPCRI